MEVMDMGKAFLLFLAASTVLSICGCEDEVRVGVVEPQVELTQDWDNNGTYEPLPRNSGEGDYLLDFGQVVVKQKSTRYITITNSTNAEVALSWSRESGIRFSEGTSPDFFMDQPPLNSLEPGESIALAV
jgi:hypothetical protein